MGTSRGPRLLLFSLDESFIKINFSLHDKLFLCALQLAQLVDLLHSMCLKSLENILIGNLELSNLLLVAFMDFALVLVQLSVDLHGMFLTYKG